MCDCLCFEFVECCFCWVFALFVARREGEGSCARANCIFWCVLYVEVVVDVLFVLKVIDDGLCDC